MPPLFGALHRLVGIGPLGIYGPGGGNGGRQAGGLIKLCDIFPGGNGIGLAIAPARGQYRAILAEGQGLVAAGDDLPDIFPVGNGVFTVWAVAGVGKQGGFHGAIPVQEVDVSFAAADGPHRLFGGRGRQFFSPAPTLHPLPQQGENGRKIHRLAQCDDAFRRGKGIALLRLLQIDGGA